MEMEPKELQFFYNDEPNVEPLEGFSQQMQVTTRLQWKRLGIDSRVPSGMHSYLHHMVSQGDVSKLKQFLEVCKLRQKCDFLWVEPPERKLTGKVGERFVTEKDHYDINGVDYQGRTALKIAVGNKNEEMVNLLLHQPDIRLGDELLCAIRVENTSVIKTLLDWQSRNPDRINMVDSAEFPAFLTPLMLACHMNNYEVILMLCQRGFTLDEYEEPQRVESLEKNKQRISMVKAKACPAYLSFTSEDPILDAFNLSHKAYSLSVLDPIYKDEYNDISVQCQQFAVDFLEECRTSEEISVLLGQHHDPKIHGISNHTRCPRLTLAVTNHQTKFVTHDNCQQVLQDMWTQNHRELMWSGWLHVLAYLIPRMLLLPLVSVGYIFYPHASVFRQWRAPIIKFTGHMTSYCIFLLLLIMEVATEDKGNKAARLNSGVDYIIWIYIMSFICNTLRSVYLLSCEADVTSTSVGQALRHLSRSIQRDWWLMYDITMEIIFLVSFIAAAVSLYMLNINPEYPNICRICWDWNDPTLVSEAFFAIAVVFAFGKLLYFFKAFSLLGPIQVSLTKMIYDVREMFLILVITVVAFTSGLYSLYHYYKGMQEKDIEGRLIREQPPSFSTWTDAFETLFWSTIGYGNKSSIYVVVGNYCPGDNNITCPPTVRHDNHKFTAYVGKILFGFYHIFMVLVLLNTLVALFTRTINSTKYNADIEWKFSRSELWMRYFEHGKFLPNPLNLMPSLWNVSKLLRWVRIRWCSHEKNDIAACTKETCCVIHTESQIKSQIELKAAYQDLLCHLFPRYLSKCEQKKRSESITKDILMQVKRDIVEELETRLKLNIESQETK